MFSSYVYYLKATYLERLIYFRNTKRYTFRCCPVTIMKKFVHLILHFRWLRGPWRRANIFWYSTSSRMMIALFKAKERSKSHCNEAIATKPLHRRCCNEAIVTKPLQRSHCKATSFFHLQLVPICILLEFK